MARMKYRFWNMSRTREDINYNMGIIDPLLLLIYVDEIYDTTKHAVTFKKVAANLLE